MPEKKNGKKKIQILLIEDNPDDVVLIQEILSEQNGNTPKFKLFNSCRLEEGLSRLTEEDIDVILLDLTLPDGRGTETLRRISSSVAKVPVVVLTAFNDPSNATEMVSLGAQDYLVKGQVSYPLLSRTLLHAIERHKIQQEHLSLAHELRRANVRLEKLVFSDPLSGLMNRRGLQEALSREIQRTCRGQEELLALILDLDNFKHVNDSLGYSVGDILLKEISQTILRSIRVTDYVARIGGDEFLILMPDTRFAEGARIAEKVRRAIEEATVPLSMGPAFKVTASFGLLRVSSDTLSIDELFAQTHHVLKNSKKMGKNRVSYSMESEENGYWSHEVANILGALRHGRHYQVLKQPIFELSQGIQVGFEFLSRFNAPGLEMPDDFFRVSLENNILTSVDSQCLKNCIAAGAWLPAQITRHVNIFPSTILDIPTRNLIQLFEEGKNSNRFCVEISEQQIIGDPSYLIEPVTDLRRSGVSIAIDDVGFGRSSLESLILLEPDVVKVDKKWVNGISQNEGCERSLRRLKKVTDALGAELVAEGIETQEDLNTLISAGVKYGQGYYLGRPA